MAGRPAGSPFQKDDPVLEARIARMREVLVNLNNGCTRNSIRNFVDNYRDEDGWGVTYNKLSRQLQGYAKLEKEVEWFVLSAEKAK